LSGRDANLKPSSTKSCPAQADQPSSARSRESLGTDAYFSGWLMRLDGAAPDEWKPETEKARQQYPLLAESAPATKPTPSRKDVEAVIRLEQMDLSELQGLPAHQELLPVLGPVPEEARAAPE